MTGFVLHPYKTKFADKLRQWLANLEGQEHPVVISSCLELMNTIDWSCESIGSKVFKEWKVVLVMAIILPLYHFVTFYPLDVMTPTLVYKVLEVAKLVEYITLPPLIACVIAYLTSVLFLWTPERKLIFQITGSFVWFLCGLYSINLLWPPFWIGILVFITYNILTRGSKPKDETDTKQRRHRFREAVLTVLTRMNMTQSGDAVDKTFVHQQPSAASTPTVGPSVNQNRVEKIEHPGVSALKKPFLKATNTSGVGVQPAGFETPLSSSKAFQRQYRTILRRSSSIELGSPQESTVYIKWILWCCMMLQLFIHPSLLHLLPIPIVYTLLKKLWVKFGSFFVDLLINNGYSTKLREYCQERREALAPKPVAIFASEIYRMERSLLKSLPKFTDTIVTVLLILTIIVGLVFTIVFVSVQMYSESLYIVQTSGRLMTKVTNSSLYQQMNDSLGDHAAYFKGIEDVVDSGYHYGREYISSSVVSMLKSESNDNQVYNFILIIMSIMLFNIVFDYDVSGVCG
jgi:hypothetical protein